MLIYPLFIVPSLLVAYTLALVIARFMLVFTVSKQICKTTMIRNKEALADITQATRPQPKFGEGQADARNVVGF